MTGRFWLFKTDPEDFSLDDLKKSAAQTTGWSGVRNYQARNFLRDEIKTGDEVFFYHSSSDSPSVVAVCEIVKEGYADETQFIKTDLHFDPKAKPENPVWFQVDIKLIKELDNPVSLQKMKENKKLKDILLLKRGNRLSVMPINENERNEILLMSES